MATRALIGYLSEDREFTCTYNHYDGYPEGLGIDIAESITGGYKVPMEIENTDIIHGDIEYIYYVWQAPKKDM